PLMPHQYANWRSAGLVILIGKNEIILKCLKHDDIYAPSKVHHSQPQDRNKSSSVVKAKASQSSSKSLTSKGVPTRTRKRDKPVSSISKLSITPSMVLDIGYEGTYSDIFNGVFDEDGATSPSCLKISSPPSHPTTLVNEAKFAVAHVKSSKASVPPSCLFPLATSNFEPQETIHYFKMSYVSKIWRALCDWVMRFSIDYSDNFSKLKEGVILILKETKGTDKFDTSALKGLVNVFFKIFEEYDAMKSSSS
ncbi:hypothetical protein HAX54_028732, partial [Datura stramonium]|nr:hypothetical protein [Datura stramonium]